jgi:two-component system, NtrC family, sensor histidine kinase AtoS
VFAAFTRKKSVHRFESEVHVGLLLIIFLLFFLTFVSNLVIHKARVRLTDKWWSNFNTASLAVGRSVASHFPLPVPDSVQAELSDRYRLSGLYFVNSRPVDNSRQAKRQWITAAIDNLPPGRVSDLADKLFNAEFGEITRGNSDEYYMLVAGPQGSGYPLVILSMHIPELAYLDDASRMIFIISLISLAVVGGLYLYLSRFIFAPFRRIRAEARRAGRAIDADSNEADAVVAEYQRAIDELCKHQEELLRLNATIRAKADTLEQFNEYVLKSTEAGVITLDMSGRILVINDTAVRLVEVDTGKLTGESYREILPLKHPLRHLLDEVFSSGILPSYREETWGSTSVGITMSYVRDDAERRVGLWILLFDLAEVTALRSELESKNRLVALGEMAGGLAHQLRNSMGAISGYGTLAKKRLAANGDSGGQIDSLLDETRQAEQLIKRFLSFARPLECAPEQIHIDQLVTEIVESFRVRDDFKSITCQVLVESDATVAVDALLFKQALGNLIDNASQAYPDRIGVIEIATRRQGGQVTITISDRGAGIPRDKLPHVFTPFYSSRPSGTGLGLPLAARIIDMHKGHLMLTSDRANGTVATITLPVCDDIPSETPSQLAVH